MARLNNIPTPLLRLLATCFITCLVLLLRYTLLDRITFGAPEPGPQPSPSTPRLLPRDPDPAFTLPPTLPGKRIVVLLTSFRSGSTFLGKLFDENPRVQYLFEPLHDGQVRAFYEQGQLYGAGARHTDTELRMLYLQQILHNCSAFDTAYYHERWKWCGDEQENRERFSTPECPRWSSTADICRYRPTTVLKVIRIRKLSELMLIRNIQLYDLRIVHSTRHPIGLMTSRASWGTFFTWSKKTKIEGRDHVSKEEFRTRLAWEAYDYCNEALETERFLAREPWFRERYLRVSHQRLSLQPLETGRSIYKHVGLHLSANLLDFLSRTTQGDGRVNSVKDGPLVTSRISRDVVFSWTNMKTLKPLDFGAIEAQCNKLISLTREELSLDPLRTDAIVDIYHHHI